MLLFPSQADIIEAVVHCREYDVDMCNAIYKQGIKFLGRHLELENLNISEKSMRKIKHKIELMNWSSKSEVNYLYIMIYQYYLFLILSLSSYGLRIFVLLCNS